MKKIFSVILMVFALMSASNVFAKSKKENVDTSTVFGTINYTVVIDDVGTQKNGVPRNLQVSMSNGSKRYYAKIKDNKFYIFENIPKGMYYFTYEYYKGNDSAYSQFNDFAIINRDIQNMGDFYTIFDHEKIVLCRFYFNQADSYQIYKENYNPNFDETYCIMKTNDVWNMLCINNNLDIETENYGIKEFAEKMKNKDYNGDYVEIVETFVKELPITDIQKIIALNYIVHTSIQFDNNADYTYSKLLKNQSIENVTSNGKGIILGISNLMIKMLTDLGYDCWGIEATNFKNGILYNLIYLKINDYFYYLNTVEDGYTINNIATDFFNYNTVTSKFTTNMLIR